MGFAYTIKDLQGQYFITYTVHQQAEESRRRWLLWLLQKDGKTWFWEAGYHGEEISSQSFFESKLSYIHLNPVGVGW